MIARRGFFGKLAGFLGLAVLPVRSDATVKLTEPEIVTKLPSGWVVTQYSSAGSQWELARREKQVRLR